MLKLVSPLRLLSFLLGWIALPLVASVAVAQAPALTHVVPAGLEPGKATDVTLHGSNLAGVTGFWNSLGAKAELTPSVKDNGKDKAKVTYRITIPKGTPVGRASLRVATPGGVSNLRLVLIDDLPTVADNGNNKSRAAAQELKLPVAVDGACEAESYDYYRFAAKAGQRVAVDAYAKRLGSALDPVIRLMDSAGRTLASSDDEGGIGADSRLSHTFKADGTYCIEIRDITYQGGAAHRYRLRVGNLPLVSTAFPLAVKKGTKAKVAFAGPAAEKAMAVEINMSADAKGAITVGTQAADGRGSSPVTVLASDIDELVEAEPNDAPDKATAVSLPAGLNGRLEKARDHDCYRFEAKKGQQIVFAGQTKTLGSPAMLSLRVVDAQGKKLAGADDPITDEVSLAFTAPADGKYCLLVREWQGFHGPAYSYRIDARPSVPGFALSVDAEQLNAPKGGVFVAKVTAARRSYDGPIALELVGVPAGCNITGNAIADKKNDTTIRVTVPEGLAPGGLYPLTIVGKAKIGDQEVIAQADTLLGLRKAFPGLVYPPKHLAGSLGLGIGPVFPDFFQLTAGPIEFPRVIGQTSFKVTAKRLNKYVDPISLAVEGLPQGIKAKVAPIAKGKGDATISLTGPADSPEGEYKITVKGSAAFQNQPKSVVLGDVVLKVVKPLDVAVAKPLTLAPGAKGKIKITATRRGGEKDEIALELKDLPKGVTAPGGIKIDAGKNDVEIELTVAKDAPAAKADNVTVVAKTKIKGKDITVESGPAVVEVKKP